MMKKDFGYYLSQLAGGFNEPVTRDTKFLHFQLTLPPRP